MAQSYRERKNQEQLERTLGKNIIGIGQIVSEEFEVKQGTEKKFGSYKINGVTVRRYKVRICHSTDGTESNNDLITVFGQSPTSGLRGEFGFSPTYPVNTYVTVARIKDLYYITEVHPNCVIDIPKTKESPGCGAASGFIPGSTDFKVPQSCIDPEGSIQVRFFFVHHEESLIKWDKTCEEAFSDVVCVHIEVSREKLYS
jgi:hypothetical protein